MRSPGPGQERFLVRGVNWLGDAVMTTPALLRLREAFPNATITLLTPAKLGDLWRHHPAVDKVISFERSEPAFRLGRRLRTEKFDVALLFPNSFRAALEVWRAGVPERIGYAGQWRDWLLTRRLPPRLGAEPMRKRTKPEIRRLRSASNGGVAVEPSPAPGATAHHIFQYLELTAELGANPAPIAPTLVVTPAEIAATCERLRIAPESASPLFALNPGAEYGPAKRWPAERFIAAAMEIQRLTRCQWLVLGGPADRELSSQVARGIQTGGHGAVMNLAGETSLRELCAVLKASALLLTNDTGPMHVAAALGTPAIVPFGSTSPELTGPGLPGDSRHRLLRNKVGCAPCFLRVCPVDFACMAGISVADVVAAVIARWQTSGR